MKKIILSAALLAGAAVCAQAQETFTPEAGDFSVEIQFNPFSDNFKTFKIDQLEGRYFFSNQDALRFGIGFGVHTDKQTPNPDSQSNIWSKDRTGSFSIGLGYERHFFNYKRVDIYAGAGIGFAMQSTCSTESFDGGNSIYYERKIYNADSWNKFDVNLFTGIDFYVYKGLYLGAELGIEVGFKNFPGQYTEGAIVNGHWDSGYKTDKQNKSTDFDLGLFARPSLRLGWTF